MTFNDIFKSSFLENVTAVSLLDMVLALALAFGLGMFIFLVYKKTYQGVMYSSSFGVTLVALIFAVIWLGGWWLRGVDGAATLYDVIRIDHWRGFARDWAGPYGSPTA